jgi:hypothetical protein
MRATRLLLWCQQQTEPFTLDQMAQAIGLYGTPLQQARQDMKEMGAVSGWHLVGRPDGVGPWLFYLTNDYYQARYYLNNQTQHWETRGKSLELMLTGFSHRGAGRKEARRTRDALRAARALFHQMMEENGQEAVKA